MVSINSQTPVAQGSVNILCVIVQIKTFRYEHKAIHRNNNGICLGFCFGTWENCSLPLRKLTTFLTEINLTQAVLLRSSRATFFNAFQERLLWESQPIICMTEHMYNKITTYSRHNHVSLISITSFSASCERHSYVFKALGGPLIPVVNDNFICTMIFNALSHSS